MTEHKHLIEALKFDAHIQSPVDDLSGGIVIMWKEDFLKLDSNSITHQGIHVLVKVILKTNSWTFSVIYARIDFQDRLSL